MACLSSHWRRKARSIGFSTDARVKQQQQRPTTIVHTCTFRAPDPVGVPRPLSFAPLGVRLDLFRLPEVGAGVRLFARFACWRAGFWPG